jgi:hypothetical protein
VQTAGEGGGGCTYYSGEADGESDEECSDGDECDGDECDDDECDGDECGVVMML